ncbi:MAG: type II secretion system major pseudopilin GspG [Candidatus Schekmanbacteria bacterium]|nr:type II secretion system major pseudopilin GspG [Candidatus Schekmanbacteria bacterium]
MLKARCSARAAACERGFTLIEIMVVVVILGILAGLVVPRIVDRADDARLAKVRMQLASLASTVKLYRLDNSRYPTTAQGLRALVQPPELEPRPAAWREGGYLEGGQIPVDPWGAPFIYVSPAPDGRPFDLVSLGADGQDGGDGIDQDISVWDAQ